MRAESALFAFLLISYFYSKLNTMSCYSPAGVVSLSVMYLSDSKFVNPNLKFAGLTPSYDNLKDSEILTGFIFKKNN